MTTEPANRELIEQIGSGAERVTVRYRVHDLYVEFFVAGIIGWEAGDESRVLYPVKNAQSLPMDSTTSFNEPHPPIESRSTRPRPIAGRLPCWWWLTLPRPLVDRSDYYRHCRRLSLRGPCTVNRIYSEYDRYAGRYLERLGLRTS
jgi:hypothetical protein